MKSSEIRVGDIYNVDFEPVRKGEFDKIHLAVVIKKNKDGRTFIVVPLTGSPTGSGLNKLHIGKIDTLPLSLQDKETYAVYDQVRTVNASRFRTLKQGDDIVNVTFPKDKLQQLMYCVVNDLLSSLNTTSKFKILQKLRDDAVEFEVENALYAAIREKYPTVDKQQRAHIKEDIAYFKEQMSDLKCEEEKLIFQFMQKIIQKY